MQQTVKIWTASTFNLKHISIRRILKNISEKEDFPVSLINILNFGNRWQWDISFPLRPVYPWEKDPGLGMEANRKVAAYDGNRALDIHHRAWASLAVQF